MKVTVMKMSEYTTELRNILMYLVGNEENDSSEAVIETGAPLLFDFEFPFYDPNSKVEFAQDFCRHFYMREIGQETYGLWKHYLRDWMYTEMPYYNKLFESAALEYEPLEDVHYSRDTISRSSTTSETSGVSDGNNTNTNNNTQKFSDTPQNRVDNLSSGYLTNVTTNEGGGLDRSHNESSASGKGSATGQAIETVKGKMGMKSYAELIQEQRDTFINVKKMCFDAMEVLFMQIY